MAGKRPPITVSFPKAGEFGIPGGMRVSCREGASRGRAGVLCPLGATPGGRAGPAHLVVPSQRVSSASSHDRREDAFPESGLGDGAGLLRAFSGAQASGVGYRPLPWAAVPV